jgi:hypothetical protein
MPRPSLRAAHEHARRLPSFGDPDEAQEKLFARRDHDLASIVSLVSQSGSLDPDFSPESLKSLEAWYLDGLKPPGHLTLDHEQIERGIAAYFGEVLVRNKAFEWFVTEYVFAPGKYEIGVRKEGVAVMLTATMDLAARPKNSRKQSL